MKYLIILIIASTCIGCAGSMSSYEGKGGPFKIQTMWEEKPKECHILSIRDTGLVIAPSTGGVVNIVDESEIQFLHRDSILKITHIGLSGLGSRGGMVGSIIGALGMGSYYAIENHNQVSDQLNVNTNKTDGEAFAAGAISGAFYGAIIGSIADISQSSFSLDDPDDKERLIALCKYCGHEPDFIHAIK